MDDWALIEEFVGKGSAGAFEALVGRYLGMVYGVAMREMGGAGGVGGHHLAEDVTQAVFALLAKKAPEMRAGTVVAGWLFRTARLTAQNAKKMERRRRFHEERAGRLRAGEGGEVGAEERMRLLDGAIARLGERDRGAVILRYYRRLEMSEVGRALGVSEGAARRRVERAVGRLRVRMGVKMGVTAGGGDAGMLGGLGVVAVKSPAGVAAGALACATGETGNEAIRVLMKGALKMMFMAKVKAVAVVATAMIVVGGAGTLTVTRLAAHQEETVPVAVQQAHDELAAMQEQLNRMEDIVRTERDALFEFRKSNDVTGVVDMTSVYVHQLERLQAKVEDSELEVTEAKRVLDVKKGAKDLPAGELDRVQEAYDKAVAAGQMLREMRDMCEKKLRDLDHFLVQDQEKAADLKAMEALRTKMRMEYTVATLKASGLK